MTTRIRKVKNVKDGTYYYQSWKVSDYIIINIVYYICIFPYIIFLNIVYFYQLDG